MQNCITASGLYPGPKALGEQVVVVFMCHLYVFCASCSPLPPNVCRSLPEANRHHMPLGRARVLDFTLAVDQIGRLRATL